MNLFELFVPLTLHHSVDARDAHVMLLSPADPLLDDFQSLCHIDGTDSNSKDIHTRDYV
jgi:hypothetical protein